ncbi:hypothetical protein HDZ31DRAFT_43144, partial [Schizophyllum fasciatum]
GFEAYVCKHIACGQRFATDLDRREHEQQHVVNDKGEFRCPHRGCPYANASEAKVLTHVNSFHRDLSGSRYQCQQPGCDYFATNSRLLAAHVRAAHGVAASPRKPPTPSPFKKSPTKAKAKRIIQLRSIQPISWPLPGPASPKTPLPQVPEDNPFVLAETVAVGKRSENENVGPRSPPKQEDDYSASNASAGSSPTTPVRGRRSFDLEPLGEAEEEEE